MEADILSANRGQCEDYSPIVTSHTFQLKMMNPKNCMSVALRDFKKVRGLIAPPPSTWKSPYRPEGIWLT